MRRKEYIIKVKEDRASLWQKKKPLLRSLDMELTERCNNNCIHCYINLPASDLKVKEKELGTEEVKEILEEAVSLGCLVVRFTGGEPLLRGDFEELYITARRFGLKVMLFTNATLITPKLADLFSSIPPLEKIEVSIYGMKRNSYEAVTRASSSYEAAWRGVNLLLRKKIPFIVKSALLPPNKGEMEEFENWAASIPWMDRPPYYSMFFDLHCRRNQKKSNLIESLRISPEEGLKIITRRKKEYADEMKKFCSKFLLPLNDRKLFSCGAGIENGCIDAYGNFQLCMLLRHPDTVYNLRKGSLKDAFENFFPQVRAKKAINDSFLARCGRCFLRGLCDQCPGKSWMESGTLDKPVEYLCEIAHVQAKYLGLLNEEEKAWSVKDWRERVEQFSRQERKISRRDIAKEKRM